MIYELKVSLEGLPLPVTRTFQIPSDATFLDLHMTIMAGFNWEDTSPHIYEVVKTDGELVQDEVILSYLDALGEEESEDVHKEPDAVYEDDVDLEDYFKEVDDTVLYKYDRPDFWKHVISLEQIIHSDEELDLPVCIDAENDAPEEHTQEEIHTFEETLRNDDTPALIEEINSTIELAFDEEGFWDEDLEQELEILVDDVVNQVFGALEDDPEEEEDDSEVK